MRNVPKLRFKEFTDEWEEKKLSELSNKIGDGIHSTPNYSDNGEYFFINGNNIKNNKVFINETTKKIDEEEYNKYKLSLNNNTILISINGTIGNLGYYNYEKVILGKSCGYINLKDESNKYFLLNLLKTTKIQSYFFQELTGTTIKNLSLQTLKNTIIKLPIFSEQQKIADFLLNIDKKISIVEEKLSLFEEYKKGIMQKIFNQELRFKDENGNDYPEWNLVTTKEIGKITMGFTPSTKDESMWNGEYKWLSIADLKENGKYIHKTSKTITEKGTKNKKILKKGTLIMSFKLTLGRLGIISEEMFTNEAICHFNWNDENSIDTEYVYYYLNSIDISSFGKQAVKGITLNTESLNSIEIELPCIEEQQKIANFLSSIDAKIEKISNELENLKEFKKGLLQQMFV